MHTFTFLIAERRSEVPDVFAVQAHDAGRARVIATRLLGESANRLGVEVWEGDALLFTLGEPYGRRTPLGSMIVHDA